MPKAIVGTLFTILFVVLGFLLGALLGSKSASEVGGLAAGATVVGYGVAGMAVALIVGIVLSLRLKPTILVVLSLVALLGSVGIVFILMQRKQTRDAEQSRQETVEAQSQFREFSLRVDLIDPEIRPQRIRDVEALTVSFHGRQLSMTSTNPGRNCSVDLDPVDSRAIVGSIYGLATHRAEHLCRTINDGPVAANFEWNFFDTGSPKGGEWAVTQACFLKSAATRQVVRQIDEIIARDCS